MAKKKKSKLKKSKKKPSPAIEKPAKGKDSRDVKPLDEEFYGYGNEEIGPVG